MGVWGAKDSLQRSVNVVIDIEWEFGAVSVYESFPDGLGLVVKFSLDRDL